LGPSVRSCGVAESSDQKRAGQSAIGRAAALLRNARRAAARATSPRSASPHWSSAKTAPRRSQPRRKAASAGGGRGAAESEGAIVEPVADGSIIVTRRTGMDA